MEHTIEWETPTGETKTEILPNKESAAGRYADLMRDPAAAIVHHPRPADGRWIVQQFLSPGPGVGSWYECRRVAGPDRATAERIAFPNGKPAGYRLVAE